MKKILITLLVLIAFWFNTYNVWAADNTDAYYLKIDKILVKYFIKMDKKWDEKAKAIYEKIISKIDSLVKESNDDKKNDALNYIKVKFVEKLQVKELEKSTKKEEQDNTYRTDDNSWTATSHFSMSQDEADAANARAAAASTVTKDEVIYSSSEKTYDEVYNLLFNSTASINQIVTALWQQYYAIQNNKTYSDNVMNLLKEDYKKSYNLFTWWAIKETSKNWITSHNWYSMYESIVFYYSKWNETQKQVLKDLWYRLENWEIVYKGELNLLKDKIQKID